MSVPTQVTSQAVADDSKLPEGFGSGRLIKETGSLCPVCLTSLRAQVYERAGQVWMDKRCAVHGAFSALLSSAVQHYYPPRFQAEADVSTSRENSGTCCGPAISCCGPSGDNHALSQHSCNILIEIIERCNLSCPTCYAGSTPQHASMMSMETLTSQVDALRADGKNSADVVQLSGGEPTLHPQLKDMIRVLTERGFQRVCINTNGIKLASEAFVRELMADQTAELSVYLQFDGFEASTYRQLRGREDLLKLKQQALNHCLKYGIKVHPVMTLTREINDHEVGRFIALAADSPAVHDVVIQPAMYSGRYDNPRRIDRLTLADTIDLVCRQYPILSAEDFNPIPCSDPNCFSMAVALRTRSGILPISRYFPRYAVWREAQYQDLISAVSDTIDGPRAIGDILRWMGTAGAGAAVLQQLGDDEVGQLLDCLVAWEQDPENGRQRLWDHILMVNIKPFMDAYTYDQDRIDRCCVHILNPEGVPVSFCEYNALHRPQLTERRNSTPLTAKIL